MRPLGIDLFCGLGGWTEGLLEEGYDVIGFDIEQHQYGGMKYPAALVLQDVLTIHGAQFKDAALIVASPPCQAYSYRAMPWKRAKALPPPDNSLFEACFRIQREASEAAGRRIPLVVENVRGAQKWVGRARWNYGSFYLWGDVPALMPMARGIAKVPGFRFDGSGRSFQTASTGIKNAGGSWFRQAHNTLSGKGQNPDGRPIRSTPHMANPAEHGTKVPGQDWSRYGKTGETSPHWRMEGVKQTGDWFSDMSPGSVSSYGSSSSKRKEASAMIAKIPLPLARHIAAAWKPGGRGG